MASHKVKPREETNRISASRPLPCATWLILAVNHQVIQPVLLPSQGRKRDDGVLEAMNRSATKSNRLYNMIYVWTGGMKAHGRRTRVNLRGSAGLRNSIDVRTN
jgi:hypothetical protein